jgi:hypothetical protein
VTTTETDDPYNDGVCFDGREHREQETEPGHYHCPECDAEWDENEED